MIVLVYGLPGTGKSHFSKHLAEVMDAYYFNTDTIWDNEKQKGNYNTQLKELEHNQLMDKAKEKLEKGSAVILDGTFHKKAIRNKILNIAREAGHRIYLIEIRATEQTVKERLKTKKKFTKADFAIYKKIKSEFEIYRENHLELYSDSLSIDEMIIKTRNFIYASC